MAFYRHATTGSNMKNLIFYPGASPQHTSPKRWLGLAMSIWLAFFITTATNAQVSITCPGTITISCSVAPDPSLTGQATATTGCSTSPSVNITHQDDTSLFAVMEEQLLAEAAQRRGVSLELVKQLLNTEQEYYGMRRRHQIYQKIETTFNRDWRTNEEILADLATNEETTPTITSETVEPQDSNL